MLNNNGRLAGDDPWELPPVFVIRKESSSSTPRPGGLWTHSGYWQEKQDEFTAIRSPGDGSSSSSGRPSYQGVKRTLEFFRNDGTKTDWIIHMLEPGLEHHDDDMFLKEDVVFLKVFRKKHEDPPNVRKTVAKLEQFASVFEKRNKRKFDMMAKNVADECQVNSDRLLNDRLRGSEAGSGCGEFPTASAAPYEAGSGCGEFPSASAAPYEAGSGSGEFPTASAAPYEAGSGCGEFPSASAAPYEAGSGCGEFPTASAAPYEAGSGCGEFPTASAAPYGQSEVWQHFTRIKTKDPGLVYAACHRCDKVLKAHPRNGTTHLKRHLDTCSCNSNPSSTTEEQEILRSLRATIDLYKQEMEGRTDPLEHNTNLTKLDPWDLQRSPCYVTSSLSLETHQGHWKEIDKERAAICIRHSPVLRYVGLKRTLKFHLHNGTKMDWIMLEYHQVDEHIDMPPDLLLEGSMVYRKVFRINDDAVKKLKERMLNGVDNEEELYNGGQSRPGRRKRSGVWLHHTKIYTTDPGRVYAVCHYCDKVYQGHPNKGTSHLKRHNETCSSKHREL